MNREPVIVWFRDDLRLADNPAFTASVKSGLSVLPVYFGAPWKSIRCCIALMVTPFLRSLEVSQSARKLFEEDSIFLITCVVSCTLNLVEAAGVEPASEIVVNKETPCSVAFRKVSRCALRTDKMRTLLVRGSRSCGPYPATETSLLCDVLPQPTGEAAEDGYLVN